MSQAVLDPQQVPELPRLSRAERWITVALVVGPLAGVVAAAVTFWSRGVGALELTLLGIFYVTSGLGVTVGFHRHFTHQSFKAVRPLKIALALAGSLAIQGGVIAWVADHRRHHAFSDREGDPHSPHLAGGQGVFAVLKGLWHAHIGWLFDTERTDVARWAPDLRKDAALVRIDRAFPILALTSFLLPALIGLAVTQTLSGALTAFVWGALVRIFLLHHVTWSINSICHVYGSRPFESRDESKDNWVLSLLSFGESWHNGHHAFPTSAVHGLEAWKIDLSAMVIKGLAAVGLASEVKVPDAGQIEAKRIT